VLIWSFTELGTPLMFDFYTITPVQVFKAITDVADNPLPDLDRPVAEIKSMYVAPTARGRGIGRRMLARLEGVAAARGCAAARLDTLAKLAPACALYESAGYEPVADYNQSPHADRWYERRLDR